MGCMLRGLARGGADAGEDCASAGESDDDDDEDDGEGVSRSVIEGPPSATVEAGDQLRSLAGAVSSYCKLKCRTRQPWAWKKRAIWRDEVVKVGSMDTSL